MVPFVVNLSKKNHNEELVIYYYRVQHVIIRVYVGLAARIINKDRTCVARRCYCALRGRVYIARWGDEHNRLRDRGAIISMIFRLE